jgi:hypothetical protein
LAVAPIVSEAFVKEVVAPPVNAVALASNATAIQLSAAHLVV